MRNEFGAELDENGYAPSILQEDLEVCARCGRNCEKLDRHEVFHGDMGGFYREKCKRLGLWIVLCHDTCHLNGIHRNKMEDIRVKGIAQRQAMLHYGWSENDFRQEFGKSYL